MDHRVINLEEMQDVVNQLTAAGVVHAQGEASITVEGMDCLVVAPQMLQLALVAEEFGVLVNNIDSVRLLDRTNTLVADTREHLVPAVGGDPFDHDRQQRLLAYAYALGELGNGVGNGVADEVESVVGTYIHNFIDRVKNASELFWNEKMTQAEFLNDLEGANIILGLWVENEYIPLCD